jgi:hypothetical protein
MTSESRPPTNPYSSEDAVSIFRRSLFAPGIASALLFAAACGNDETAPPADDHTPVSYTVFIDGIPATAPYALVQGETVRVRLKFLNASSEDLDAVESTHFAGLTFNPGALATVTRVADHHYQFDVTGGAPATGTVQVSFGHDELADENTFTPVDVAVDPAGGGGAP